MNFVETGKTRFIEDEEFGWEGSIKSVVLDEEIVIENRSSLCTYLCSKNRS